MKQLPTVFLIDDDAATRLSVEALLAEHRYSVKSFKSAEEFLTEPGISSEVGCVVVDLSPPVVGGRKLLQWLDQSGSLLSVVVTTGLFEEDAEWKSKHLLSPPLAKPYEASALLKMVADGIAGSLSRKAVRDRRQ